MKLKSAKKSTSPRIAPPEIIEQTAALPIPETPTLIKPRKTRSKPRLNKDGTPKQLSTLKAELEKHLLSGVVERPPKYASSPLEAIEGKLFLCVPKGGWGKLARRLSRELPGQIWVGSSGLTHVSGGKVAWVTSPSALQGVLDARLLTYHLVSQERWIEGIETEAEKWKYAIKYQLEGLPYSIAGCARLLLAWTKCRQPSRELDIINADSMWQFQLCKPAMLERAYLWDITSCYYALLCRAPSPYVGFIEGKLTFFEESEPGEFDRWFSMLGAVGSHKPLRNSLVGQMFSSGDGEYYFDGRGNKDALLKLEELRAEEALRIEGFSGAANDLPAKIAERTSLSEKKRPKPGCLRPLASLVVRTAYELACLASKEEKALYSNTDCVITANPYCPQIWGMYGLEVALKGAGKTEICCIGNYRVGQFPTKPYRAHRKGLPRPRVPALPDPQAVRLILRGETWVDKWLKPAEGWEPSIGEVAKVEEREETARTMREIAKKAVLQAQDRLIAQEERAREEEARQEYAAQVGEAF